MAMVGCCILVQVPTSSFTRVQLSSFLTIMSDRPTLTLYSYFRSSASARVRTALAWHGVTYEVKFVHLLKGEQRSDEYAEINPAKTIPTLVIKEAGGSEWKLTQSAAIIEWVDEVYGPGSKNGRLLPQNDTKARALIRSIVDLIVGDLFPFLSMATLNRVKALGATAEAWCADNAKGPLTGGQSNGYLS